MEAYEIRKEAERLIGEDYVPTDVLEELIAQYGDQSQRREFSRRNHAAAQRGEFLIARYTEFEGIDDQTDEETHAVDIIADLLHFVDQTTGNALRVNTRGLEHFQDDVREAETGVPV